MPARRRLKKEEEEKLREQKKSLKKSFQKTRPGSKRVGSKRISDTKKYLLIMSVAIIIAVVVMVQFLIPPDPTAIFTEGDFVHATLSQESQDIFFDKIIAWYYLKPRFTSLNGYIDDYFNDSYDILEPSLEVTPTVYPSSITYDFAEKTTQVTWSTTMENGTPLDMSTWVNLININPSPAPISRGNDVEVNCVLELNNAVAVDSYNISLDFYDSLVNTTITFSEMINGTYDPATFTFFTSGNSLPASSSIILSFNLTINSDNILPKLNLLESGEVHLVMNNKLLGDFPGLASDFAESIYDFTGFGLEEGPTLTKSKFLDIVIDVPYFNVTLTG